MNQSKLLILFGFLLVAICLSPIIRSSLYSDDIHDYQLLHAYQPGQQPSAINEAIDATQMGIALGRFAPLSLGLQEVLFTYIPSVKAYKAFTFIVNLLAVAAFAFLLHAIGSGIPIAIWAVFYVALIQLRPIYHDAYTSVHIMYPFLSIYIFLSLAFYCRYIASNKNWQLGLSVLLCVMAYFASEVGLVLPLLLIVTAWAIRIPLRKTLITAIPFMVVTATYLGIVWYVRSHADTTTYSGLNANLDVSAMWQLFSKQVYGSLPLSALHRQKAIPTILLHQLSMFANILTVVAALVLCTILYMRKPTGKDARPFNTRLFLFSFILAISPAIFIMPSLKYQQEVLWGMAYLPVYIQAFGVATLLACIYTLLANSGYKQLQLIGRGLYVTVACVACISFLFSNAVVDRASYTRGKPAEAMFASVQHGILNQCLQGSTIVLTKDFIWRSPHLYDSMFTRITGKDFIVQDAELWQKPTDSMNTTCYILDCEPGNPIVTSLYTMNCETAKKQYLLGVDSFPCDIKLIPEEENIGYR